MSTDTTLVLGATGKTGRRVAARLRLAGTPVRTASRSSQVRFDWHLPDTWDAALRGVTAAYLIAPDTPSLAHDVVTAVEAAGVRRLVLLSGRGADTRGDSAFGRDMRSAEDAVRGAALEWTILRASNFQQNFDEDLFHGALVAGDLALPAGDVPEPFVDVEDVADVAAAVLARPGEHAGRTYELTGPRALTFDEAVDQISRASGSPISYRQVSATEYVAAAVEQGVTAAEARSVADMFELMADGRLAATTDDVTAVLRRPPRTFEEYVVRAAAAGAWTR